MENDLLNLIYERSSVDKRFAVLIRHSIRESIGDNIHHETLHLTEEGRQKAIDFGVELPSDKLIRLFYSPVPRCRETAEYVQKGIISRGGSGELIGVRDFLGVPFTNFQGVLEEVKRTDISVFTRRWLNDLIDIRIIDKPYETLRNLTNGIISTFLEIDRDHIDLHVSHDWNLLVLREFFLGIKHEDVGWPDFLDGIILYYNMGRITAVYGGIKKIFNWSSHAT